MATKKVSGVEQPTGVNPNPATDGPELETNSVTVRDTEGASRAAGSLTEVEPGVFHDSSTGVTQPQHYKAAVVFDDELQEATVKTPLVTPEEYNNKMNPADARINDSEFVVRAPHTEAAQEKIDEGRKELPKEAQDPEASSR
jgi:hypothetical protein